MDKKISLKKMVSKSCDGKGGAASNFASSGQISQTNKSIGTKFPSLGQWVSDNPIKTQPYKPAPRPVNPITTPGFPSPKPVNPITPQPIKPFVPPFKRQPIEKMPIITNPITTPGFPSPKPVDPGFNIPKPIGDYNPGVEKNPYSQYYNPLAGYDADTVTQVPAVNTPGALPVPPGTMVNSTTRNPKKDAQGNVISSWNNPPGTFKNDPAQTDAFNKILKQYIVGLPIPYGYGKLFQQMEAGKRAKLTVADMGGLRTGRMPLPKLPNSRPTKLPNSRPIGRDIMDKLNNNRQLQ